MRKINYRSESAREMQPEGIKQYEKEEEEETDYESDGFMQTVKRKAGQIGVGFFVLAAIFIIIALCTSYWIESDRIYGTSRFERMGLWTHCLKNLPDPFDPYARRYTAGCKAILGVFSSEAWEKRIPGLPASFVAVQFLYTFCVLAMIPVFVLIPIYLTMTCFSPYHERLVLTIKSMGHITLASAFLGLIAVIIFGANGSGDNTPELQNRYNFLSWSYAFGVVGVLLEGIAGGFFELEGIRQVRKRGY